MERVELGRHIVSDPGICQGQLTFKGTRILVSAVLEHVAEGRAWDWIVHGYGGSFPTEAIAEAVRMASRALLQEDTAKRAAGKGTLNHLVALPLDDLTSSGQPRSGVVGATFRLGAPL